jgi:hypothetical protein
VERFLKCIIEGIYIFKTNKAKTLAVFKRYMKGADDEILEETYQATRGTVDEAPYPSLQVVKSALDNAVVAISSGETNRRELDRRTVGDEKDRRERIHQNAV